MRRLIVRAKADQDVREIAAYLAQDSLDAALRFVDAATEAFDFLAGTPGAGPRVDPPLTNAPGLRTWPITGFRKYLVVCLGEDDGVTVVRVMHGARDWKRQVEHGL